MDDKNIDNQSNEVVKDAEGNILTKGIHYTIDGYGEVKMLEEHKDTEFTVEYEQEPVKHKTPQRKFTKSQVKALRREFLGEVFPEDIQHTKKKANKKADNRQKNKQAKKQRKMNRKRS